MKEYELMLVLAPVEDASERENFLTQISDYIEGIGKLEKTDMWGLKRLAYEINDFDKGYYYLLTFGVIGAGCFVNIAGLDKKYKYADVCLRHMIIRKGE